MSRKFMFLMLVIFGALLYAASYALNKQTEPPPPPTPEESAQRQAQMRKAEAEEYAMRKKALDAGMKQQAIRKLKLTPEQQKKILNAKGMPPLPPADPKAKAATRGPNDMLITNDWTSLHQDGAAGIAEEIKVRQAHAKPGSSPPPPASALPSPPAAK